jgi:hypothetical protein
MEMTSIASDRFSGTRVMMVTGVNDFASVEKALEPGGVHHGRADFGGALAEGFAAM